MKHNQLGWVLPIFFSTHRAQFLPERKEGLVGEVTGTTLSVSCLQLSTMFTEL